MKDTVYVFARAPRLGAVKRRLAAEIGTVAALQFYRATLAKTLRRLQTDRRFATVVAITPDRLRGPWLRGLPAVPQGGGDLGLRMQRALARSRRAVVVGSDIPDLQAADVARAFRLLRRADACFGPAEDGGYYLAGAGPRRPRHMFAAVRWSGPHALADTLRNFAGLRVAFVRTLRDVDGAADLRAMRSANTKSR